MVVCCVEGGEAADSGCQIMRQHVRHHLQVWPSKSKSSMTTNHLLTAVFPMLNSVENRG